MEIVSIVLNGITLTILFVVLAKLGKISRQLEIPIVKKLTPEMKLKTVRGRSKTGESNSSNNRGNRNNSRTRSNTKNDKQGERQANPRRKNTRNRYEGSKTIVSNQEDKAASEAPANAAESKKVEAPSRNSDKIIERKDLASPKVEAKPAPAASVSEKPKEAPKEAPKGRPALAPRGANRTDETSASVAQKPVVDKAAAESGEGERKIRHGRRNQVKKVPAAED